jgi:hypothetical protein
MDARSTVDGNRIVDVDGKHGAANVDEPGGDEEIFPLVSYSERTSFGATVSDIVG